jgi:tRNA threonylcarbamoyl adenosine modification protein YeaZ
MIEQQRSFTLSPSPALRQAQGRLRGEGEGRVILAIDCATARTGLALLRDGGVIAEACWMTKHNQTVELYPRLDALFKEAGTTLADVDAIAVSRGPGSYNGVRVGMAAAKGFAFTLSIPLVGVSTLEAEAWRFRAVHGFLRQAQDRLGSPRTELNICAVLPLGHDYAVAIFEDIDGQWMRQVTEQAMTTDELIATIPPGAIVTGELPERLLEVLHRLSPDVEIACEESPLVPLYERGKISRAAALGQIGHERYLRGETDTATSLQALYLRRPQVTPPKTPRDMSGVPGRGVIWDVDGVIIDSAELHFRSWREALSKRGIDMSREQFEEGFGRRNDDIIAQVANRVVSPELAAAINREKEEAYRQMVAGNARFFPGVMELMRSLKESGFKQAVASSAPPENLGLIVKEMKLEPFIEATVDASMVTKGKPDPEVFLKAAAKLGLTPKDCLVIEDAVAGVEAAKSAGMAVIAVSNTHPKEKLAAADLVVSSLEEVEASRALDLINANTPKPNPLPNGARE